MRQSSTKIIYGAIWPALTLVLLMQANSQASDEVSDKKYVNSKLSYIRRFASPVREPLKPEALFVEKESRINSSAQAKKTDKISNKTSAPAADIAKPASDE